MGAGQGLIQHQAQSHVHQGVAHHEFTMGILGAEQSGIQHQIFGLCVYQGLHIGHWRLTSFFHPVVLQIGTHWVNIAFVCSQYFQSTHVVHHLLIKRDCNV